MKGIILAGGAGTRLYPLTTTVSKQLLPVYDKPMIYYPLATLMLAGIRDILLITTPDDVDRFKDLLGGGARFGVRLRYATQARPRGIAEALIIADTSDFGQGESLALILGDNLFYGRMGLDHIVTEFKEGAHIFGYPVKDPERYGVVTLDADGRPVSLEEKPVCPKSRYAVPGLYLYGPDAGAMARALKPSERGELEITDLNRLYMEQGRLTVTRLGRGIAWLDTGTPESLLEAGTFVRTIQARQGLKIACLEEIAYERGWFPIEALDSRAQQMPACDYGNYLRDRVKEERNSV